MCAVCIRNFGKRSLCWIPLMFNEHDIPTKHIQYVWQNIWNVPVKHKIADDSYDCHEHNGIGDDPFDDV